jgi:hypothetical protein
MEVCPWPPSAPASARPQSSAQTEQLKTFVIETARKRAGAQCIRDARQSSRIATARWLCGTGLLTVRCADCATFGSACDQGGRSKHWVKVKHRKHFAVSQAAPSFA